MTSMLNMMLGTITAKEPAPSFWMPSQSSSLAGEVDWIFYFIYWLSVFFFVLIVGLMIWFVLRYRRRQGQEAQPSPTHHTALELTWTIIPLILVIVIFYIGLKGYVQMRTVPQEPYEVMVTGQSWSWTFDHPNGAKEAGSLTVPLGRPVKLTITSTDVLHSVFIPAFRVKQDAVPGRYTSLWFTPTQPGIYDLLCAEYCGTEHSTMNALVRVMPQDAFDVEIEKLARWIDDPAYSGENLFLAGMRLYRGRCNSCHLVSDERYTGPSFWNAHDDWGKARQLDDGSSVIVDENYIRTSILYPDQHIVATFTPQMQSFQGQLNEKEIQALIQFIKQLDKVVDRQGTMQVELPEV
jgi:cytochrome c oxidase subunit 2